MKKIVWCLIVMLPFMSSTFCSDEDDKVKPLWFKGFEIFENAEKVEKEQGAEKSMSLYEDALKHFKGIKIKYPEWNPSFISYRISVCEKKIEKLKGAIANANTKKAVKPALPPESPVSATTTNDIKLLKERLDAVQKKLDNALVYVAKSQKEIDRGNKAVMELEQMSKYKSELEKRYSLLSEELQKIRNNSFLESPETKNVIVKLQSQFDELNKKYEKTLQDNRELTEKYRNLSMSKVDSETVLGKTIEENQNMKKVLAEAVDSAGSVRADLGESSVKSRKQAEEIANLKTIIEEEKKKSGLMDDKFREISEKSGGLSEHLNSENELLKKDLELLKIKLDSEIKEKKELQDKTVEKDVKIQKLNSLAAELGASSKRYSSDLDNRTTAGDETLKKNSEMVIKIKGLEEQNQNLSDEIKKIAAKYESFVKKDKEYTELAKYCLELEEKSRNDIAVIDKAREENSLVRKELQSCMIKKEDFDRVNSELGSVKLTIAKLNVERASLAADKEKAMLEKNNTAEEKGKISSDLERISKDKEKLQAETYLALKEKDEIIAERDKLIAEKEELASKSLQGEGREVKLHTEKGLAEKKMLDLTAENAELSRKIKEAEAKVEISGKDMKDLAEYCVTLKEKNNTGENSFKGLQERIAKIEKENRELREAAVRAAADSKEKKAAPDNAEKDELTKKFLENQKELNSLKEKIALGNRDQVNAGGFSLEEKKILFEAAQKSLAEGNKDSALWHYEKILSKNPEDADACKYAAAIELEKGGNDRAIELYERAAKKYPGDKELITGISFAYLKKGDYFSGMSYLSRGLASSPDDPDILRNMGVACSSLGWKDAAEKLLRKSLGSKPDSKETLFNLAVLLAVSSEPPKLEEAEKLYRRALELGAVKDPAMEELFRKK